MPTQLTAFPSETSQLRSCMRYADCGGSPSVMDAPMNMMRRGTPPPMALDCGFAGAVFTGTMSAVDVALGS